VQTPKSLYLSDHAHFMTHHAAKFNGCIPFTAKATSTDMSNFKPIFDPTLKKL